MALETTRAPKTPEPYRIISFPIIFVLLVRIIVVKIDLIINSIKYCLAGIGLVVVIDLHIMLRVAVIRIAVVVIIHSHILILLYLCVIQGKMVRAYRI